MRLSVLIVALAVAVPAGLCAGAASAQFFQDQDILLGRRHVYEGRWCAHINSGADRVEEVCHFDSFEACRREVTGGNQGFCVQNPAFAGDAPPVRHKKPRGRR